MMESTFILGDCFDILPTFPDQSFDSVIMDPPYEYLKHKLDLKFDKSILFKQLYNLLLQNSFLVFTGKGRSFYECINECFKSNFDFKEDIIWDKLRPGNPLNVVHRIHENIAILNKGKISLNKVYIDKIENDLLSNPQNIINDFKRLVSSLQKIKTYNDFEIFINNELKTHITQKHKITIGSGKITKNSPDRGYSTYLAHTRGRVMPSILRVLTDHYNYQHPTQKPVALMKRLIELTTPENAIILDPFAGSGTLAIACLETGRRYVCIEKEVEYYDIAMRRIEDWHNTPRQQELELG